jgi:ribosome-associated toxin RatA of RatAB toxin-antitoxin module
MKRIARSAIVGHAAGRLYGLVEDIEAYPAFLPWCLGAQVHERSAVETRATLTVGVKGVQQAFTTRNRNLPGESIDMELVEGPFRHFRSVWRFIPLAPDACRIEFALEYEFSSRALALVLEPLFNRIADTMVDAFTERADSLYGQHPG